MKKGSLIKKEEGMAILLSLVIVSVLFIVTSFLIRQVVMNAMMVGRFQQERVARAIARQGVLYAVYNLSTSHQYENWGSGGRVSVDLDGDGTDDVELEVTLDSPSSGYITIESWNLSTRNLPPGLMTLQGVGTYSRGFLLSYGRFINETAYFSGFTFGDATSGFPFRLNNDLILEGTNTFWVDDTRGDRIEVGGDIVARNSTTLVNLRNTSGTLDETLDANEDNADGRKCGFTRIGRGTWLNSSLFSTVGGRYFDGFHLPSSWDLTGSSPQYVRGSGKKTLTLPQINESFYSNLAGSNWSYTSTRQNPVTLKDIWLDTTNTSGGWNGTGDTYTPPQAAVVKFLDQLVPNPSFEDWASGGPGVPGGSSLPDEWPTYYNPVNGPSTDWVNTISRTGDVSLRFSENNIDALATSGYVASQWLNINNTTDRFRFLAWVNLTAGTGLAGGVTVELKIEARDGIDGGGNYLGEFTFSASRFTGTTGGWVCVGDGTNGTNETETSLYLGTLPVPTRSIRFKIEVSTPAIANLTYTLYVDDVVFFPIDPVDDTDLTPDFAFLSVDDRGGGGTSDGTVTPYPSGKVLYFTGGVRVRGRIGTWDYTSTPWTELGSENLTLVTGGTIYIEGSLEATTGSSLVLLARDWVCLNQTRIPLNYDGTRKDINLERVVLYAQNFSFACIPQQNKGSQDPTLTLQGGVIENIQAGILASGIDPWYVFGTTFPTSTLIHRYENLSSLHPLSTLPPSVNLISIRRK